MYTLTNNALAANAQTVIRDADGAHIPPDPKNADFAQYLAWLAVPNTPTPAASNPVSPFAAAAPTLTFLQFMALFTAAEQAAIVNSADTQTRLFLLMATGAGEIVLSNPELIAGVNYLAATSSSTPPGPGLIALARVAQILANTPPT